MDKVPKKKTMSVTFSCALFYHLDFLTLEGGTERLSSYLSKKLPLCAAKYLTRPQTSHDSVMQSLVWLHKVWFRAIQFGAVRFSASYVNLRPHIRKR